MYFRLPVSSNNLQKTRGTRHKARHTVYGVQKDMQEESRQINSVRVHSSSSSVNHAFVAALLFAARLAMIGTNPNLIADSSATFGDFPYHLAIFRVSPYVLKVDVRVLKEGFD